MTGTGSKVPEPTLRDAITEALDANGCTTNWTDVGFCIIEAAALANVGENEVYSEVLQLLKEGYYHASTIMEGPE